MKRFFKFRKDFRCNWDDILGLYDTDNLENHPVTMLLSAEKHMWHHCKSNLLKTVKHYCDIFVFESDGETQEYVDELNKPLSGCVYFVRAEDEADTIEELCDCFVDYDKEDGGYLVTPDKPVRRYGHEIYGAIWTSKGLIYVAKTNEKGEFELL